MKGNTTTLTLGEARQLLGLIGKPSFRRDEVEQAYLDAMRKWTKRLSCPLVHGDRDMATTAIGFLPEAKRVCLAVATTGGATVPRQPVPRTPTAPAASMRPTKAQARCIRPRRQPVAVPKCCRHLGSVFVGLWNVLRECWRFLAAIPGAVVEIKDFVVDGIDRMESAGVPRGSAVLILLLGSLPLVAGCVHAARKVIEWFH